MAGSTGNPSFDLFQLPEEHVELRAAIRALSEKEIAPHAAEVDAQSRFPEEALSALAASGFSAVHVPDEYGGQGADSVATCIVRCLKRSHPLRQRRPASITSAWCWRPMTPKR